MSPSTRRPLTLHVSALSNAEYLAYTASLVEATAPLPDVDWEALSIGVREARGWIKGRYGVDGAVIDQILRYFCPNLAPQDTLTAGQFFAALRLVLHAQNGATVNEELVFVQANPERARTPSPHKTRPTSVAKSAPPPPPRPANASPDSIPTTPNLPPRVPSVQSPNPFTRAPRPASQPLPAPHVENKRAVPSTSNPFRRVSNPNPPPPSLSSTSSASSASPINPRQYPSPPLPPRKPPTTLLPPPRHASLSAATKPSFLPPSPAYAHPLPVPPVKPPKPPQATSALIKQSLQAAKGAQSRKEELDSLKKARRLEVIKKSGVSGAGGGGGQDNWSASSASASGGSRNGALTPPTHMPFPAPAAQVRVPSPPASFYDVAHARIGGSPSRASSPTSSTSSSDDPQVPHTAGPEYDGLHARTRTEPAPLFMHTLDPASPISPTNPRRTRSLHQPRTSLGAVPPAPPPRRRPESIEVTPGTPRALDLLLANGHANPSPSPLSRHLSLTSSTLHRAFEGLRPGPGFESARVKAEGRIWPGGYVKGLRGGGGERLVGDGDDGFGQDVEEEEEQRERDAMKVPVGVGEGWRPLG